MADRYKEAKELAESLPEFNTDPKLMCLYGDMQKDHTYYKKAWKISGKKYANAKRALARYYFYEGNI